MPENISFAEFFKHLHNCEPFPWQERLAKEIRENGKPPAALNLPTASGKTAIIDIWLWCLYKDIAENKPDKRRIPLRLFYIVDRRIIADAAFERAEKIKEKLQEAESGILRKVADGLKTFYPNGSPLETAILRGGMALERNWCKSPAQPMVCCGTVDMIGSRLLFRGYGLSPGQRPIDAGLVGRDAMIVLDEAHISQPFEKALKSVKEFSNLQTVSMSATGNENTGVFNLEPQDLGNEVFTQRFTKKKPVSLVQAKSGKIDDLVKKLAEQAKSVCDSKPGVIAVIANTVDVARETFKLLEKEENTEAILLTGRSRPLDREALIEKHKHRLFAESKKDGETPLYVVATQCIEVGADFDFDAMVTEIAPLDSLIQRFGRLNRLGNSDSAKGVIVAPPLKENKRTKVLSFGKREEQTPFYGNAPSKTWEKMVDEFGENGEMDFSSSEMKNLQEKWEKDLNNLRAPRSDAPAMAPEYIDILSRTSVEQFAEPDVSLFLHGESQSADVQVVWRGDVPEKPDETALKPLRRVLSHLPPQVEEAVSLSLRNFKNWMANDNTDTLADVEGGKSEVEYEKTGTDVMRWRGYEKDEEDRLELVSSRDIKPGDVVVLPSKHGGCDEFGWNPKSKEEVRDIAKETRGRRRTFAFRVHPDCCDCDKQWNEIKEEFEYDSRKIAEKLFGIKNPESCVRVEYGETQEKGFALLIRETAPKQNRSGEVVGLEDHNKDVARIAEEFAKGSGLSVEEVDAIKIASEWHDAGKAEIRWQKWAKDGKEENGQTAKPLTDLSPKAWEKAGLSSGERHEYWSYLLAKTYLEKRPENEKDLILHLIASHHGNARPFPLPPKDGGELARKAENKEVEYNGAKAEVAHSLWKLDSGFASRFAKLNKKYGYWKLAYLEAILRLADYEQSKRETK